MEKEEKEIKDKEEQNSQTKEYVTGLITGVIFSMAVLFLLQLFGVIPILFSSSLSTQVSSKAREAEAYIDKYYWKEKPSDDEMSDAAIKGMVYALGDRYSEYYSKKDYEGVMDNVEGSYSGIGVTILFDVKSKKKTIGEVKDNSPAKEAGIEPGDILIGVNDTDVSQMDIDKTIDMIDVKEGKKTVIKVQRTVDGKQKTLEMTVQARMIVNQSVEGKMLDNQIGYIKISHFDNESVEQFRIKMQELEKKNQKKLIIDLRDNGGGSLTGVVDIVNQILAKGKILSEKNKSQGVTEYNADDKEHFEKPIAVLINGGSASASEVMAGALQDHKKALLVGEKSFGKGIVQAVFQLKQGGGIKLTTGEYLLPSGRCIHEKGLTPDFEVKYTGSSKEFGGEDDNQLQKAIEILK